MQSLVRRPAVFLALLSVGACHCDAHSTPGSDASVQGVGVSTASARDTDEPTDAVAAASRSGGPLEGVTAVFESQERACAIGPRDEIWCWSLGDDKAQLESCGVPRVATIAPGAAGLGACLSCETTVSGDSYCWTRGEPPRTFQLPQPSGSRATDVETDTAFELLGRQGVCSAVVLLADGTALAYEIDSSLGLSDDGGVYKATRLALPAPAARVVMKQSSVCAVLRDRRVWCSFYLDAKSTRINVVGHAPSPAVMQELFGASDVRIDGMCAIGVVDHRERKVCVASFAQASGGELTVTYRRTVQDAAESTTTQAEHCVFGPGKPVVCGVDGRVWHGVRSDPSGPPPGCAAP